MGKHFKNLSQQEAADHAANIQKNPKMLARWLCLLDAVRIINKKERQTGQTAESLPNREQGNDIIKYIDKKAPAVEQFLLGNY